MKPEISIFTDGSCNAKEPHHYGGWGVYIVSKKRSIAMHGGWWNTTTPRMEMMALLRGIEAIDGTLPCNVTIYCDSQFVVNAFRRGWIRKWRLNGWQGVANSDLWKRIVSAIEVRRTAGVNFRVTWVRGHGADLCDDIIYGNACADALADYRQQDFYDEDLIADGHENIRISREDAFGVQP